MRLGVCRNVEIMKHLFVFSALYLLVGCTDPASTNRSLTELKNKLDALHTQISAANDLEEKFMTKLAEQHDANRFANFYWIWDSDRKQTIAYAYSTRPIQKGEHILLGDDMWRVEEVMSDTKEKPPEKDKPSPQKLYSIARINLAVKFLGKGSTTPIPPESPSPTPR
jgi:hypothetical protein